MCQIRAGEGCVRVEGTVWNTLIGGGKEKRGGETKTLKGGQAKSRGGCLKKGWVGTPLQTMIYKNLCYVQMYLCKYVFIHISISLYVWVLTLALAFAIIVS